MTLAGQKKNEGDVQEWSDTVIARKYEMGTQKDRWDGREQGQWERCTSVDIQQWCGLYEYCTFTYQHEAGVWHRIHSTNFCVIRTPTAIPLGLHNIHQLLHLCNSRNTIAGGSLAYRNPHYSMATLGSQASPLPIMFLFYWLQ